MNTYLIISNTIYHTNLALSKLKEGILNVITFNLEENTLDEVLEEASYFSMFDDEKCLIVKNAHFFESSKSADSKKSKEDADKLIKYLANENPKTRLIFLIKDKVDTKKKIYNLLKEQDKIISYPKMTKTEMKNTLVQIVKEAKYQIEDQSLWYILNNSLANFDIAYEEIKKIMLYYNKPTMIKYNDVLKLTSKTVEENNFKLVDSIIMRDLNESLKNLEESQIMKVEPTVIISLLAREFRLMLSMLLYEELKYNYSNILKELHLVDWQGQKVLNNLRMYNKKELKEEIVKLSNLDYKIKSGLLNKDVALISYIIDLCL